MKRKKYGLLISIFLLVFLILFSGISGMRRPEKAEEKSEEMVSESRARTEKIKNEDYADQNKNPLIVVADKDVTAAVNQYYIHRGEQADYIEYYKDIKVYTKEGPYRDSYIVFARYNMKIKGIYTEVPGLDTLYLEKDEDGKWKLTADISSEEIKNSVQEIAVHTDVEELLEQTQTAYEEAVASDAILREALSDLENAI